MKRAAAVLLLAGCTSHTAAIGEAASDVRTDVAVAREHLGEARAALERIDKNAAQVHNHLGHVSDDANPFVEALRYGSYIVVGVAVIGAGYFIYTRIK